jgi:S1-C subfamily serine protease
MVRAAQELLRALDYDVGEPDGVLGAKTRAAVQAFQSRKGLPATGTVDEMLLVKLSEAVRELRIAGSPPKPRAELARATVAKSEPTLWGSGTGFVVDDRGHVVTNNHVVAECKLLKAVSPGQATWDATLVAQDAQNDLAVIKTEATLSPAVFREGKGIRQGDAIVLAGFPLRQQLSSGINISTGIVSALSGIRNDARHLQISAAVQPVNSGGTIFDQSGNVVGMVVSKLNWLKIAQATGSIPENVNFGIKDMTVRTFLDANGIGYGLAPSGAELTTSDIAERARRFTLLVECWK